MDANDDGLALLHSTSFNPISLHLILEPWGYTDK